ncbi:hypothetical protein Sa4125_41180 [Aureimonas sp. SA4125]|nr:hypothetical protein Sa4125_41180 [Aureimonas sp. SA4125]
MTENAVADCMMMTESPRTESVPWIQNAVKKPATFANAAAMPDVGTVLAISAPFGPGEETKKNVAKANVSRSE